MKTKRRVIASAAIGVVTAGLIGFGAHTATAEPATSDHQISSVDCSYYAKQAKNWAAKAKHSKGHAKAVAQKQAAMYKAKYQKCIGG